MLLNTMPLYRLCKNRFLKYYAMHISAVMCILNFYFKKYKKNYFLFFTLANCGEKSTYFLGNECVKSHYLFKCWNVTSRLVFKTFEKLKTRLRSPGFRDKDLGHQVSRTRPLTSGLE